MADKNVVSGGHMRVVKCEGCGKEMQIPNVSMKALEETWVSDELVRLGLLGDKLIPEQQSQKNEIERVYPKRHNRIIKSTYRCRSCRKHKNKGRNMGDIKPTA